MEVSIELGVSILWLVFVRENPTKIDENRGYPYFRKPPIKENVAVTICCDRMSGCRLKAKCTRVWQCEIQSDYFGETSAGKNMFFFLLHGVTIKYSDFLQVFLLESWFGHFGRIQKLCNDDPRLMKKTWSVWRAEGRDPWHFQGQTSLECSWQFHYGVCCICGGFLKSG